MATPTGLVAPEASHGTPDASGVSVAPERTSRAPGPRQVPLGPPVIVVPTPRGRRPLRMTAEQYAAWELARKSTA